MMTSGVLTVYCDLHSSTFNWASGPERINKGGRMTQTDPNENSPASAVSIIDLAIIRSPNWYANACCFPSFFQLRTATRTKSDSA